MYTITMSVAPMARPANGVPLTIEKPTLATRKNVPMNSVRYRFMRAPSSGAVTRGPLLLRRGGRLLRRRPRRHDAVHARVRDRLAQVLVRVRDHDHHGVALGAVLAEDVHRLREIAVRGVGDGLLGVRERRLHGLDDLGLLGDRTLERLEIDSGGRRDTVQRGQ